MGMWDDIGKAAKGGIKKVGGAAKDVGGALVTEEAWKRALPGGEKLRLQDVANMALDASILVPGAGLAGGAARIAAKKGLQEVGEAGAKKAAQKVTRDSLRSPANKAIRSKFDDAAKPLTSKLTTNGGARKAAKDPLDSQLGRMAAKQKAGVGTKVGMGQTKKRVLRNTALVGGANALETNWDAMKELISSANGSKPKGKGKKPGAGGAGAAGTGTLMMMGADGEAIAAPPEFQKAMAAFAQQGGNAQGSQVFFMGN